MPAFCCFCFVRRLSDMTTNYNNDNTISPNKNTNLPNENTILPNDKYDFTE